MSASNTPDAPYDPYIPSNKSTPNPNRTPNVNSVGSTPALGHGETSPITGDSRTARLQAQIDDVTGVMRENINKVSQRGERLDNLQDKTDNLAVSANGFRRGANRVRKQMWWKDVKMRMCLFAGIIILLIVIIVPAVVATKH